MPRTCHMSYFRQFFVLSRTPGNNPRLVWNLIIRGQGQLCLYWGWLLLGSFTRGGSQKLNARGYNLCSEALDAILVLPGTGLQTALNVDLTALGEVLCARLGLLAPNNHSVPLGLCDLITTTVGVTTVGCNPKVCDWLSVRRKSQLNICAQISHKSYLIDSIAHFLSPFLCLLLTFDTYFVLLQVYV